MGSELELPAMTFFLFCELAFLNFLNHVIARP